MKNFAKLALLFSISFLVIFLLSTVFRFLALRVDWAKSLPAKPETALSLMISAAHWALSLALFASILFALSYTVRKQYSAVMSVITLMVLSFVFCLGFSSVLNGIKTVKSSQPGGIQLGDKGIILSMNETSVILLNGTAEPLGPRVVSIPGQPLAYQDLSSANDTIDLPPVPFGDDSPWFLKSLAIDLRLNSELFRKYYSDDFGSFLIYTGSLIFLLCSFGCLIKFSVWPMANLFLGILVFRGILAFEIFLISQEIQETMASFLKDALPVSLAMPIIFLCIGALLHFYSLLIFLTKKRDYDEL